MVKPSTPGDVEVNGHPKNDGMVIDTTTAKISAHIYSPTNDSGGKDPVRLNVKLFDDDGKQVTSDNSVFITTGPAGGRTQVAFAGLKRSQKYVAEIRAYTALSGFSNSTTVAKFKVAADAPGGGSDPQVAQPPVVPSAIEVNGVAETPGMATKTTVIKLTALVSAAALQRVRIVVQLSTEGNAGFATYRSAWATPREGQSARVGVAFGTLVTNTHYTVKVWSETDLYTSTAYAAVDFYTNRNPNIPELVTPLENSQFPSGVPVTLTWKFSDPDDEDQASAFVLYRVAGTAVSDPGPWQWSGSRTAESVTIPYDRLSANQTYEWKVQTSDSSGLWSGYSLVRSFYVSGATVPPLALSPAGGEARDVGQPITFTWQFRSINGGDVQVRADLQYRPVGTEDWFVVAGDTFTPGAEQSWTVAENTFMSGAAYEWQVRTYGTVVGGVPSDWSYSQWFWGIYTPGSAVASLPPVPLASDMQGLGCGTHRVFVYDQGGQVPRGEITPLAQVKWNRKRDDISNAVVDTTNFGEDCCALLGSLRSWIHELVIFRDGPSGMERVFEGPITRITYTTTSVEIEAKDVMAYAYRRIMRQGYNDAYQVNNPLYVDGALVSGTELGLSTTVDRANWILVNALARHDPNVLPFLTTLRHPNDARQSRVVPDYAKTAWEEIDDMAAHAGLDYVTVGRRIILWDTHRPIGRLPEMRDNDFSDPPIVTEYGMNLANYLATTDGSGVWGAAYPNGLLDPLVAGVPWFGIYPVGQSAFDYYGPIEMLNSAYAETTSGDDAATDTLSPAAMERKVEALRSQSQRSIANRWPTPLLVRVPDNVTLNSDVNLSIQQLVPGVWIPLRAQGTCRDVAQWQKLDSVTVTEADGVEKVQVVMSPAPNGGNDDPDADAAAAAEAD